MTKTEKTTYARLVVGGLCNNYSRNQVNKYNLSEELYSTLSLPLSRKKFQLTSTNTDQTSLLFLLF